MFKNFATRGLAVLMATSMMTTPVLAQQPHQQQGGGHQSQPQGGGHQSQPQHNQGPTNHQSHPAPMYKGHHSPYAKNLPPERHRTFHGVHVYRPYGHVYPGFGYYTNDADAVFWLAFTAFTVILVNELSVQQQRSYENAIVEASEAPVGETITWKDGNASGQVVATREGTSSLGRYCREFQQTVTIGGKQESAYGTACRGEDGQWEIIDTSNN